MKLGIQIEEIKNRCGKTIYEVVVYPHREVIARFFEEWQLNAYLTHLMRAGR